MQTLAPSGRAGGRGARTAADPAAARHPLSSRLSSRARRRPGRSPAEVAGVLAGLLAVAGATAFVLAELHPSLLFSKSMDVGGDNAAHVAAVHYFVYDLLPRGQLSGWDPQWFDGFPAYVFYFPLPALLVALLTAVVPYAVAFKLVTVSGLVAMPLAAWAFGRLAGFARPVPALMGVAMLPFLFNTSYEIDGGNIASTLAGEFSFTLALVFGLLFLGTLARSLETGRGLWLPALLYAATVLCHVVPAMFFAVVALFLVAGPGPGRRLVRVAAAGAIGTLLVAFYLVPFASGLPYTSSMGYSRVEGFAPNLLPTDYRLLVLFAAGGTILALWRHDRRALVLAAAAAAAAVAFQLLPSGQIYNGRWLPFWFLFVALLAAWALGELFRAAADWLELGSWHGATSTVVGTLGALALVAAGLGDLPGYHTPAASRSYVPGWISWNYTGYQGKPGWPLYERIVAMLDRVTAAHGCGRLQYEYTPEIQDAFGSTMALMSLPLWTHGCVQTTSGLYFESSTTTPFHFLDQSEFSLQPSEPVSGLDYPAFDIAAGVRHLQLMGVRYFLASSPTAEAQAAADPALVRVGSTPGEPDVVDGAPNGGPTGTVWAVYLVRNAPLVSPLTRLPTREPSSTHQWLETGLRWYEDPTDWPAELTRSGPESWPKASPGTLVSPSARPPLPAVTVSHVRAGDESVSFEVSRTGVPVLVKVPYFPNWHATGARGPYEAMPNLMVVVPTSRRVTLTYGTSSADVLGDAATLLGTVALAGLVAFAGPGTTRSGPPPSPPVEGDLGALAADGVDERLTLEEGEGSAGDPRTGELRPHDGRDGG